MKEKRVAIVGIQGIPAGYGGFETLVENIIGDNCSPGISYTVFCSGKGAGKTRMYKNVRLKYIPCPGNGMMSVLYDAIGLLRSCRGYDVILVLGVSGCLFLPVFRLFCGKKIIVNIDGLEHRRDKWGRVARWFLRVSEASAVRFSDVVVADNKAIQDYVRQVYGRDAELITYGGDHVLRTVGDERETEVLNRYSLLPGRYAFSVCRIEPENNCHLALDAFARTGERLVFIGNWNRSEYGKKLKKEYLTADNIILSDPVYDLDTLYVLRKHARHYIHGHSAGGTNPSLVEAMHCGCNVLAFDCGYNRLTTENKAYYFRNAGELASLVSGKGKGNSDLMVEIARRRYIWRAIAKQYENLY